MRLIPVLAVAFVLLLSSAAFAEAERSVLVIPKGTRVQYWEWVRQGAEKAGKERGVNVIYRGPRVSDDYAAQEQIVSMGIADGVDAIVVAPSHESYLASSLEKAAGKGMPVVLIDSDMKFDDRTCFVGTDNHQAGVEAAKHVIPLIDNGSHVLVIRYLEDNTSTHAREDGFSEAMALEEGRCKVVQTNYVGPSVGAAYHKALEMFEANPDIHAVFAPGEAPSLGVLKALGELGKSGEVVFVGFDYTREIHDALESGAMLGTVVQSPFQMGYQGVMAACDAMEGKPVEKRIVTPVKFLTKNAVAP